MSPEIKEKSRYHLLGVKSNFRFNSIQTIITFYFTLLITVGIILICIILYNKFYGTTEYAASVSTSQIIDQVNANLKYYLKTMNEVSGMINNELKTSGVRGKDNIEKLLKSTLKMRKDIVTLAVFSSNGELLISSADRHLKSNVDIDNQGWFSNTKQRQNKLILTPPHVENLFPDKHPWVVSLSRETSINDYGKMSNGILLLNMNFSSIADVCSNVSLGKRGYMYIIDSNGNIIYHPQQQMIYAGLKQENLGFAARKVEGNYIDEYNGEQAVISIKKVSFTDWKLVGVNYLSDIITIYNDVFYFIVIILTISILVMGLISVIMSARISDPLKRLEKLMKKVEAGDFNIYAEEKGEYEVRRLAGTFNLMIARIKKLMDENRNEQEQKRKSELKALQAQINPHFLYNTLDSIVWMAENKDNQGVVRMVTALANLFRMSISSGRDIIDISEELEHAKNYLIIQEIRYGEKFSFSIDPVPPEVLRLKTIKTILQPIIENSIYHGIKPLSDSGHIHIGCRLSEGKVCLFIEDNGVGMSLEKCKNILTESTQNKGYSGIGVKNVHERIKLYFGPEYGLEIISELDIGTRVNIWLPKFDISPEDKQ